MTGGAPRPGKGTSKDISRARRIAAGVCIDCASPDLAVRWIVARGKWVAMQRCEACAQKSAASMRAWWTAHGGPAARAARKREAKHGG